MSFAALSTGGGSADYLAYKAQENPHWRVDGESAEITKFLLDYDSLKTGWQKLAQGEAPHNVWAEVPGTTIPRPSEDHRQAFLLWVYLKQEYGSTADGWREWSSSQTTARIGLEKIGADLDAGAKKNKGKAAVIEIEGYESVKLGAGTHQVPKFKLSGWAKKPANVVAEPEPEPVAGEPEDANVF